MGKSFKLQAPATLPPRNIYPVPTKLEAGWVSEGAWLIWRRETAPALDGNRTTFLRL